MDEYDIITSIHAYNAIRGCLCSLAESRSLNSYQRFGECLSHPLLRVEDGGRNPLTGKRSKSPRYRICDNYTRFYLKYIAPYRDYIKKGAYDFVSVEQLPGWNGVLGLQFEALVYNNLASVMRHLELERTLLLSAAPYCQGKTARCLSCQIDLLLQTKHTVYVIEIKRREIIGEEVVAEMRERIGKLKIKRGVNVVPVLIYAGALTKRVQASGFFARIISAEDLIEG